MSGGSSLRDDPNGKPLGISDRKADILPSLTWIQSLKYSDGKSKT